MVFIEEFDGSKEIIMRVRGMVAGNVLEKCQSTAHELVFRKIIFFY